MELNYNRVVILSTFRISTDYVYARQHFSWRPRVCNRKWIKKM